MSEGIANVDVSEIEVAICEALRENDPDAHIRMGPAGGKTTIDGHFDLRFVAEHLLRRFWSV